jgi:hypothetical protein
MKLSATTRRWIYSIIAAAVPLLVTLDIIGVEVGGHLLAIASAVLAVSGSALALNNVNDD